MKQVFNFPHFLTLDFFQDESDICTKTGIAYINLPVRSPKEISPEFIDLVASKMKEAKAPFLLHCKGGFRAAVVLLSILNKYVQVSLLMEGKNAGASPEDVISWGGLHVKHNITSLEGLGYKLGGDEKILELLNTYLKK